MSRRHYLADACQMTDRERILSAVAMRMVSPHRFAFEADHWETDLSKIRPGDLVKCGTQRSVNRWNIAWYIGPSDDPRDAQDPGHVHLLREIGGETQCRMSNESISAIRGIPARWLLEGHQWRAYVKTQKAVDNIGHYNLKLSGVAFADRHTKTAQVAVRPHLFRVKGQVRALGVPVEFNSRTTIAGVERAIRAATDGFDWSSRMTPTEEAVNPNYWAVMPDGSPS